MIEQKSKLSFLDEDEEEQTTWVAKRRNFGKNPDANTVFLKVNS